MIFLKTRWNNLKLLYITLLLAGCAGQNQLGNSIPRMSFDTEAGTLVLKGLSPPVQAQLRALQSEADWKRVWPVYVGDTLPGKDLLPYPVLGQYDWNGKAFTFTPRYPWMADQSYIAYLQSDSLAALLGLAINGPQKQTFIFTLPSQVSATTTLTTIYPTLDTLPANLLRFYLHFSAPMSRTQGYQSIKLLDANRQEVPQAFVELQTELWDPSAQRMTVFLHPGRIKQGLAFREKAGPVLEKGGKFCLQILSSWEDANGKPLKAAYEKCFWVAQATRKRIAPEAWQVTSPKVGTQEPLQVQFEKSLDHALVQRMLTVTFQGNPLGGMVEVVADGKSWAFSPTEPWIQGAYKLHVDPLLEDLAGNTPERLFDAKMGGEQGASVLEVAFLVGGEK